MKSQVFVLVPADVPPDRVFDRSRELVERHGPGTRAPGGERFDYVCPARRSLHDPAAEARLPPDARRDLAGSVSDRANLPADFVPSALVTPDGEWHDSADFGSRLFPILESAEREAWARWTTHYRELMARHPSGWVVELWAHS